ncbi:peptidase C14 [Streptomyces harbinensis]|uniref:peptidase C14 n=1 Tax=Streptomyces harbinensis TaxID=1176198 RepID=UPI001590C15D|nr:peptidase C14 [Streptomyces harbinensis]QKV69906.1 peptidase C14 [Streptomyces harbinensis]
MNPTVDIKALRRTNGILTAGTWLLTAGVVSYSLTTAAAFVEGYSRWELGGIVLALMVDLAFVMSLQADAVLARHDVTDLGAWPAAFRWFTGAACVFLNTWYYVQRGDVIGVAVHLIAPTLLLLLSEVAPVYRRAMARVIAGHAAAEAAPAPPAREVVTLDREPDADPEPEVVTEVPLVAEIATVEAPKPAPAPAVAVPPALVAHAQRIADTHKANTGLPMDAETLRVQLNLPAAMADSIAAQLT